VHTLDPLADVRWARFLERHPRASVFHTPAWLDALRRTYGYSPVVLSVSPAGETLDNGIVFCEVDSWLTGRRLVSVPFADHCDALVDEDSDGDAVLSAMIRKLRYEKLRYAELRTMRPFAGDLAGAVRSQHSYYLHRLDLRPSLDELFRQCHRDSTQRKIRRAEREGLRYEEGISKPYLDAFYSLLITTRRRHQLPPQPRSWFQNLIAAFGPHLKIRVAFKENTAVAAILTIRYKDTLYYKYGCSDERFHNTGAMHLLFWKCIEEGKQDNLRTLDFGRTDLDGAGLVTFKDRWGGERSVLSYTRFTESESSGDNFGSQREGWKERTARRLLPRLPGGVLISLGELLYRHVG
jgi:lipid II:glycine glycyltransferase (peptidoglycan interpeptide bridge formation enzyme)